MVFHKLGERALYVGSLVSVVRVKVEGPGGEILEREVVRHPGAVTIVPIEGPDVLLVRQYRAAAGTELMELPAGKRDVAGEDAETTARRELQEEIGLRATSLEKLAEFYNSPGFCDEHTVLYLARGLEPVPSSPQGVEERHLSVVRLRLEETPSLIASGRIVDAKTIAGLFVAREALS